MAESLTVANNALIHLGSKLISALSDSTREALLVNERIGKLRKSLLRMHPWNFATKRKHLTQTLISASAVGDAFGVEWLINSAAHGLATGERVLVDGGDECPSMSGQWYVTVYDADTFSLDDSVYDATESAAFNNNVTWVKIPVFEWDYQFAVPSGFLRLIKIDGHPEHKIENGFIFCDDDTIDIEYIYDVSDDTLMDALFLEAFALGLAWNLAPALTQSDAIREQLHKEFRMMLAKARHTDGSEDSASLYESNDFIDARTEGASPFVRDPMT